MDIIASLYTILLVKQLFNEFSIALYVKKVILPCFIVTLISLGSVYVINQYLQPIITQYFIDNKSEIWSLSLIIHSKG